MTASASRSNLFGREPHKVFCGEFIQKVSEPSAATCVFVCCPCGHCQFRGKYSPQNGDHFASDDQVISGGCGEGPSEVLVGRMLRTCKKIRIRGIGFQPPEKVVLAHAQDGHQEPRREQKVRGFELGQLAGSKQTLGEWANHTDVSTGQGALVVFRQPEPVSFTDSESAPAREGHGPLLPGSNVQFSQRKLIWTRHKCYC